MFLLLKRAESRLKPLEQTVETNRNVCRLIIDRCKQHKAGHSHVTAHH